MAGRGRWITWQWRGARGTRARRWRNRASIRTLTAVTAITESDAARVRRAIGGDARRSRRLGRSGSNRALGGRRRVRGSQIGRLASQRQAFEYTVSWRHADHHGDLRPGRQAHRRCVAVERVTTTTCASSRSEVRADGAADVATNDSPTRACRRRISCSQPRRRTRSTWPSAACACSAANSQAAYGASPCACSAPHQGGGQRRPDPRGAVVASRAARRLLPARAGLSFDGRAMQARGGTGASAMLSPRGARAQPPPPMQSSGCSPPGCVRIDGVCVKLGAPHFDTAEMCSGARSSA